MPYPARPFIRNRFSSHETGFNIIELMLVLAIIGILASLALPAYRDNSRRAVMAEVLLAASPCRMAVAEGWLRSSSSPGAGNWGCESSGVKSKHVGLVQTTQHGEVRIQIRDVGAEIDGRFVIFKPYEVPNPPATGGGLFAAGQTVKAWKCGVADSDTSQQALFAVLPSTCRDVINLSGAAWAP